MIWHRPPGRVIWHEHDESWYFRIGRSCNDVVKIELRRPASFRVEVDALPGGYLCLAAFVGDNRT